MKKFLTAMGVDTSTVQISSIEGLFIFSFQTAEAAQQFASRLNAIVQKDGDQRSHKSINLAQIIDEELVKATCADKTKLDRHRRSCAALLEGVKEEATQYKFSQDTGLIEVTLPDPAYATTLNILSYPHLTFTKEGKLVFDIKKYLANVTEEVVKVEGLNATQSPLVFTDGGESGSAAGSEERVKDIINALQPDSLTVARNKFYIFSYEIAQSQLMKDVAAKFLSPIIETNSPVFLEAQKKPDVIKSWAAMRDLFNSRIIVEGKNGAKSESTYSVALDMSGQLAALKPQIVQPGENVSIVIRDGNNNIVVQSTKKIPADKPIVQYGQLLNQFGINASDNQSEVSIPKNNTPALI